MKLLSIAFALVISASALAASASAESCSTLREAEFAAGFGFNIPVEMDSRPSSFEAENDTITVRYASFTLTKSTADTIVQGEISRTGETDGIAFTMYGTAEGFTSAKWEKDGFTYTVLSDLPLPDLTSQVSTVIENDVGAAF